MLGKERQKYLASLQLKKKRKAENKILVEGVRSVREGLLSDYLCLEVFVSAEDENNKEILQIAKRKKIKITDVTLSQLKKITATVHPQNIAALFEVKETKFEYADFLVLFDRISDPGNLGTLIRTADWFGAQNLIVSCDSVDILNPKVIRSTMGSFFHVNYKRAPDLPAEIRKLKEKGYQIALADLKGIPVGEFSNGKEKLALILSNEAEGPGKNIREVADVKINIPKTGNAESLNVSVAGGILIYELSKHFKTTSNDKK